MRRPQRFRLLASIGACALAVAMPATAIAAPPASGLEGVGRAIADSDLGEMRGKFIGPSNIGYFGVEMKSSWQGPDGITTAATLLFTVNFANGAGDLTGATPVLMIGWTRDGDAAGDVAGFGSAATGDYVAIPVGGLGTSQGAVQSQQVAGSDNSARNDMRIAVVPVSSIQPGTPSGLTAVTAGQSHEFGDGDTLQFQVAPGQLGIVMGGGGNSGQIQQGIDGAAGQASQHVLLTGNNNGVHNSMNIVVGNDQLGQAGQVSLDNALSSLQGIGL